MVHIIVFLTFLFLASPINSQEFFPYQNNPVIKKDAATVGIVQPYVLKEQNMYSIWFSNNDGSRHKIFRMQSANGIDWYDKTDTKVTSRNNANDPFVFLENNQYNLYFSSSNYGYISLWRSSSVDGITFIPDSEKEILKSQMPWEGEHLSCPAVIKENNLYYLFYAGSGVQNWGIGLATSSDGQNWQKCSNNPFIAPGASGHVIKHNNIFYLYFQSPNGLEMQQSDTLNGCNTIWTNRHVVQTPIWDPSPISDGTNLRLYGTHLTSEGLEIGLSTTSPIPAPTYPIVIIPGMFASWNKDALLHNVQMPFDSWKMNPSVSEYSPILQTLQNNGKTLDSDVYIFPYDWRKPIVQAAQDLNSFITKKIWSSNKYQPIQLIGHSLGGVVGRTFVDINIDKPIKQLVTAGSPHLGAVQSYKPLVAGEIDRENTLMWLAEKFILNLNKTLLESDRATITRMLPVLSDLIPSFSFLKDEQGQIITNNMQNSLLSSYPIQTNPLIPQFYLGSNAYQMNAGYILGARTTTDLLFDLYTDGHPTSSWKEEGDETTLLKSSLNQFFPIPQANHGEIIYGKESIKAILSKLNISVQDSSIPEGKATSIFPAIFAFIQSPATIAIDHAGSLYGETDGMIHIQHAENGEYSLSVTGQSIGDYTISIWLIGSKEDKWIQFKKTTNEGRRDKYIILFDIASGGSVQEYIEPSVTPTPNTTQAPLSTYPTPQSQVQSSSLSKTTPTQTMKAVQNKNVYSQKSNYPISSSKKDAHITTKLNKPNILGASTANKTSKNKKGFGFLGYLTIVVAFIVVAYLGRMYLLKYKKR
ncbi:MAG: hypothetical protein WA061_07265 [Microgenomates group bacterium]